MNVTTEQTNQPMNDAWESAQHAEERRIVFGQVQADSYYCVLIKGQGKVVFDPNKHSIDLRRTAVDLIIHPLNGQQKFPIERKLIAESGEWPRITLPSLKALGIHPRTLDGRFCKAELVPSGTYKNDKGEEKQRTAIKFVAFYSTEEACRREAEALYGPGNGGQSELPDDAPSAPDPAPSPGPSSNGANPEKETARKFLPALWKSSGGDIAKFAELLAKTPPVNKHFTIESPEVQTIIAQSVAA